VSYVIVSSRYSAVDHNNMHRLQALQSFVDSQDRNASVYTLNTLGYADDPAPPFPPETPLIRSHCIPPSARIIFNATLKMAVVFIISTIFLGGTLWLALPTLDAYASLCFSSFAYANTLLFIRADRPLLHIPKSFQQLKDLNALLKKYRDIHPYRILVCYVTTYLLCVFYIASHHIDP